MRRIAFLALILACSPAHAGKNEDWAQLVKAHAERAIRQNGGKNPVIRLCEPEDRICTRAIIAKYNGVDMSMHEIENLDGKLIGRLVCKFNEEGDIRSCVDFDRKTTTRSVKDVNGKWQPVGAN